MRIRSLFLLAATSTTLAGCADANPVSPLKQGQRFDVNAQRSIFVNAVTVWEDNSLYSGSGGYMGGLATPVGSGGAYVMGYVEADGNSADYFVEQAGYTGQLDAFSYYRNCTYEWYIASRVVSTAGTLYLADYPYVSSVLLKIHCPGY